MTYEYRVKIVVKWHREHARRLITGFTFEKETDAEDFARGAIQLGAQKAEVIPAQVHRPTVSEALSELADFIAKPKGTTT